MTVDNETTTYTYDENGNMLSYGDVTQTYDECNRLLSYRNNGKQTNYTYGPDDMRRSKTVSGVRTEHVWSAGNIILDRTGSSIVNYIYGKKLAYSNYGYYSYNAHGDVTRLTDNYGDLLYDYEYDPYGVQLQEEVKADKNPFRYTGEYSDFESGYVYLRARYYDPRLGIFINRDPAKDGANWYVYCAGDPINRIDPSGLSWKDWGKKAWNALQNFAKKEFGIEDFAVAGSSQFFNLGKGWTARMEDAHVKNGKGKHIVLEYQEGKRVYAQNDDGSPHDKNNNSPGSPPKKVQKRLKEKSGWDWEGNVNKFAETVDVGYGMLPSSTAVGQRLAFLEYPDGAKTVVALSNAKQNITSQQIWEAYRTAGTPSSAGATSPGAVLPPLMENIPTPQFNFAPKFNFAPRFSFGF